MEKKVIIEKIMKPIAEHGFKVYFVGGCVRDELMGLEPHDYDIVTSATPFELHRIFTHFADVKSERFGITIVVVDKENIEIATFRNDVGSADSRHPDSVKFVRTVHADAFRRDFRMNAIYEDMNGNIIDPVNGTMDIRNNFIMFVGNVKDRLEEDHLRLLRFFRFISTKDFNPVSDTIKKIKEVVSSYHDEDKQFLASVSSERIGQELRKLFGGKYVYLAITLMDDCNVLSEIFGIYFHLMLHNEENEKWHKEGNTLAHSLLVANEMSRIEGHDYLDVMAALLHDVGKPVDKALNGNTYNHAEESVKIVKEYFSKWWNLTKEETNILSEVIGKHMVMKSFTSMKPCNQWKIIQSPCFDRILRLAVADDRGSVTDEGRVDIEDYIRTKRTFMLENKLPAPIVTGNVLIENGFKPSKNFKKVLETGFNIQLGLTFLNKGELTNEQKNSIIGNCVGLLRTLEKV